MSRWKKPLVLGSLFLVVGCKQWNSVNKRMNSTGQSQTTGKPVLRDEGSSTVLALFTPIVEVRQGQTKAVNASIERKANSDGDVELRFSDIPRGVSFDPPRPVIKRHGIEGSFSVVTTADAEVGEHTVQATAHPQNGDADFTGHITLKIAPQ